jgi:N-acetylneuraminic acid mutarotase
MKYALILTLLMAPAPRLTWFTHAPLPHAQAGGAAMLFGTQLVVAGGTAWQDDVKQWLSMVQIYDTVGDTWRRGPELPEPLAYGPFAAGPAGLEIFGGGSGTASSRIIWRLDERLEGWHKAGETPGVHLLGRAARVGERVFLFGGCADAADLTQCSDAVWMREAGGAWRQVARLPGGPVALSAVAVEGQRVYLFGGCSMAAPGQIRNHAEAWSFDAATWEFRRLKDLPAANRGLTAATAAGRIWLFGGYTGAGFTAETYSYDPAAGTYTREAPLPAAMTSAEFAGQGNRLWAAGGEDRMKHRSAQTMSVVIGR